MMMKMMTSPMKTLLRLTLLLASLALSSSCGVPPGGCLATKCSSLDTWGYGAKVTAVPFNGNTNYLGPENGVAPLAFWYGLWNTYFNQTLTESRRGGPFINYEVFPYIGQGPEAGFVMTTDTSSAKTLGQCCTLCAKTAGCKLFQWFSSGNSALIKNGLGGTVKYVPKGFVYGQQCYLLSGGSVVETGEPGFNITSPYTGTHTIQKTSSTNINVGTFDYPPSFVGGWCNAAVNVTDDPHFVGAHGTRYDFNGEIGGTFALISDERLHINIKLGGYEDSRTFGATKLKNGKALRTWIKEVGLLWKDDASATHTVLLIARGGKEGAIGEEGYLAKMILDGVEVGVPAKGEEYTAGALTLKHSGVTKKGPYDMDNFFVKIKGLIDLGIQMRPAHPLLQTPDDAEIHFNVNVNQFEPTEGVHGVLGQTFRKTGTQFMRAVEYQMLTRLLNAPIAADGDTGLGFLDGVPSDYTTTDPLKSTCKFCRFDLQV